MSIVSLSCSSVNLLELQQKNLKKPFDPGPAMANVGEGVARNDIIEGALELRIRGDGSCWVRALWLDVFNQILDNLSVFNAFLVKVQESSQLNQLSPNPIIPDLIEQTIYILRHLKILNEESRKEFLNHENVDNVLSCFMRYVAAAQIEEEQKRGRYQSIDSESIKAIRTDMNKYGSGIEIDAFVNYFQVSSHVICRKSITRFSINSVSEFFYSEQRVGCRFNDKDIRISTLQNQDKIVARFALNTFEGHFNVLIIPPRTKERLQVQKQNAELEESENKKMEQLLKEKQKRESELDSRFINQLSSLSIIEEVE